MKILQNRLRFSVGVQYKPSTVMRGLVGSDGAQTVYGRDAGGEQVSGIAELLVSAVCSRRMRAPGVIHLRFLGISIIFGVNFCCVHILLVICAFLHRKNEHLFDRGQFG